MRRAVVHLCFVLTFYLALVLLLSGCYSLPLDRNYRGPALRPLSVEQYYARTARYGKVKEELIEASADFNVKKFDIESPAGGITFTFYQGPTSSKNVILVFPILKGKPLVESYFARYFVMHGFDAVIVGRQSDFIDPDNVVRLEQIIHDNVVRDRFIIDFLQEHHGKTEFGSFGISRGATNADITAGVDARLKHNVLVLGGSDLPKLFEKSDQGRIRRFVDSITTQKNITDEEFFTLLRKNIKSDPKYLASFIDARHTLMILGLFDHTVPIKYGRLLRKQIGNPKTIFLVADHYTSLAFTQILCSFLPSIFNELCIFPFDYIETEALNFFRVSMSTKLPTYKLLPYRMLRFPFDVAGRVLERLD